MLMHSRFGNIPHIWLLSSATVDACLHICAGSQVAPVVDASSAQSRADVVAIFMSAVLLLTGLQWAALTPREAVPVEPDGPEVEYFDNALPEAAVAELKWCAA